MSERLELIEEFQKAQIAYQKAKTHLDILKDQLKEMGSFTEAGYMVEVSYIERESISLKDIKVKLPDIYITLQANGLISKSESERLTVKLKEQKNEDI